MDDCEQALAIARQSPHKTGVYKSVIAYAVGADLNWGLLMFGSRPVVPEFANAKGIVTTEFTIEYPPTN